MTQRRALKKLEDSGEINDQVNKLIAERKKLNQELKQFDFITKIYPSDANFLLVVVDDAIKRYNQFLKAGIVLRDRSSLKGCKNTLRITIGTPEENVNFIKVCKSMNVNIGKKTKIKFVKDRPGHDFRYAIDAKKIKKLNWRPKISLNNGLNKIIDHYVKKYL